MLWVFVVLVVIALYVLVLGFRTRCPDCGKLFSVEQVSAPVETNKTYTMGWSINPMVDKDLKFSGFSTGRVPKSSRTIRIRYRCKSCGYEFELHQQIASNKL